MGASKPVLPVIAVCCVVVGWLMWACVPAVAAAPEAPEVSVELPVGASSALVRGVLNPGVEGGPGSYELGTYEFLYKQGKASCEGEGKAPASPGISLGEGKEPVSEVLKGLSPGTEYSLCLLARSGIKGEASVSPPVLFRTAVLLQVPVTGGSVGAVTASTATFEGVLNPAGKGEAGSYEFLYRVSGSECQGEGEERVGGGALGEEKESVSAEVSGLAPNTSYMFCLLARNGSGETALGQPVTFTTLARKPSVSGESFSKVGATGAMVSAQVETGGLETTLTVQYGTAGTYGSETTGVTVPAGTTTATTQLTGLESNTEYHFRVMVANKDGSKTGATDTTFRTLPAGTVGLPDNRVYEMVTPVENGDSDVERPRTEKLQDYGQGVGSVDLFQVAADGSRITYPVLAITGANSTFNNQYIAERSPDGRWSQRSIQPNGYYSAEYQGFSSDLSVGIIKAGITSEAEILPPLAPNAPGEGYRMLYERATSESGYRTLITDAVKLNRQPNEFGSDGGAPVFVGGNADFKDLLFETDDALFAGEDTLEKELEEDVKSEIKEGKATNYLYDEVGGRLSLVDVSADGKVVPNATFGSPAIGPGQPDFSNVISADGGLVYWTDRTSGVVYLRQDGSNTVQVSGGVARYWTSSVNGRYAFYTEGESEGSELYRFDAEPEAGHAQREVLTAADAGVLGVIGASENGETVYFVAKGVLSGANGEGVTPIIGDPNVYVLSRGSRPVFIATLSEADGEGVPPFEQPVAGGTEWGGDWQPGLGQRTARVTGNGGSAVFMSNKSLSVVGYPHGYPSNGLDEVYVYEAGSDRLYCTSCGSSGEALPGGEGAAAYLPVNWHLTYLPQWISEDGNHVFFDTGQPLVAQDTNGLQDVYEWEREGYGSCTHGAGSTGGCVFLLSGGTSEAASWFVGASASGDDAFVVTRAQLVPEDQNDAFDLYDTRVDGVKPVTPPACTGSGCQGTPSPPPLFATPPSVTFNGVGNFTALLEKTAKAKLKSLTHAQKLASALRVCKKLMRRKRREFCKARARRLYGTVNKHGGSLSSTRGRKHA